MNQPHAAYLDQIQRNQDDLLEPSERAELLAHLDSCEACAHYAQQLAQLEDRLSIDLPAAVPENVLSLEERTRMAMDIVRQERKEQMNQRLSNITRNVLLVGSAIVLLVVFVWAISHVRPTLTPAADATLTAAVTPPPESTPTEHAPSATPAATEQTSPERFSANAAGLSFDIPQGWKASSANPLRYEGPDGFFEFQEIDSAGSLMQACESIGNDERYGESPRFELTAIGDRTVCIIYTSLNRSDENQDSLVFADDDAASPQRFFRLDAWDAARFAEIQESLKFTRPETAQVPNDVVSTPDSSQPPAEITPIAQQAAGLTIEEYPVVDQDVDTPTHFEFNDRIPAAVFEKRQAWRGYDPALQLEDANRLLEPFEYTLVASAQTDSQAYNLIHAGQPVLENIVIIRPVSIYPSGEDFLLQVETQDGQPRLVQKAGVQPWDPAQHYYFPAVLVGDKIAYLQPVGDMNTVGVWVGDEMVFRYNIIGLGPSNPIKGLVGYGDHWALEIDGMVFIDGQSLNEQIGATEVFDWHILNGQPFYFFQKDQQVSISYAGEVLPVTYDRVIHDLCCEPAGFNPGDNANMTWFYALRDGMWTYVEIGSYPE